MQHRIALIDWSLTRGIDPDSGRAPRRRARWPQIEHAWQRERHRLDRYRRDLIDDYSNYFGTLAADRFNAFVAGVWAFESGQGELFV